MTAPLPVVDAEPVGGLYTAVHIEPLGGDRYCVTGSGPDGHRSVVVTGAGIAATSRTPDRRRPTMSAPVSAQAAAIAHALAERLRRIDNRVEATVVTGQLDDCEVCDESRPGDVEITWQPVDDLRVDRIRTCAECAEYWIREWVLVVIGDPDVTPSVIEVEVYVHTAVAVPRGDAGKTIPEIGAAAS